MVGACSYTPVPVILLAVSVVMLANALDATRTAVTAELFCNAVNFIFFPSRFLSENIFVKT